MEDKFDQDGVIFISNSDFSSIYRKPREIRLNAYFTLKKRTYLDKIGHKVILHKTK